MNNNTMSETKVSQALHGYRDGHKLIASSCSLDEYSGIEMARMSDLMPKSLAIDSSYLCGYPLKSINKYVFARTWPAYEMPRPGCVWTHSIILDYSTVAKLSSLVDLLVLFKRPSPGEYQDYSDDILISSTDKNSKTYRTAFNRQQNFIFTHVQLKNALAEIYFGRSSKVVISSVLEEEENSATAILIWNQMPPRLRRDFAFCTDGGTRSRTPAAEITLIISRDDFLASSYNLGNEELSDFELIYQDSLQGGRTELRSFVARYATDAKNVRSAVPKLAKIADKLFISDTPAALRNCAIALLDSFPDSSDCRLLKRELLTGTLLDGGRFNIDAKLELIIYNVLPVLRLLENYNDLEAIKNFVTSIGSRENYVNELILSCWRSPQDSLGHKLTSAVCSHVPVRKLAAMPFESNIKLTLASFVDNLLTVPEFWESFTNEPTSEDWESLNEIGNLEILANGFLSGRMYTPVQALLSEQADSIFPVVIKFLLSRDASGRQEILQALRAHRDLFLTSYYSAASDYVEIVNEVAQDIFHSPYPEVDCEKWLAVIRKFEQPVALVSPHLAYILFEQAGWARRKEVAIYFYRLSFEVLHSLDSQNNKASREVVDRICRNLPADYGSLHSDAGSRIRRKFCDFFQSSGGYKDFFSCVQDDSTLEKLFVTMNGLWRGREWLQELLNAINSNSVSVTPYQRQLLVSVLPKKRKSIFDIW